MVCLPWMLDLTFMSWKSTYNGYNPSKAAGFIHPTKVVSLLCTLINLTSASSAADNPSPAHQALSLSLFCLFFFLADEPKSSCQFQQFVYGNYMFVNMWGKCALCSRVTRAQNKLSLTNHLSDEAVGENTN